MKHFSVIPLSAIMAVPAMLVFAHAWKATLVQLVRRKETNVRAILAQMAPPAMTLLMAMNAGMRAILSHVQIVVPVWMGYVGVLRDSVVSHECYVFIYF